MIWRLSFQSPHGSCVEEEFGGHETVLGSPVSNDGGLVGRGLKVRSRWSQESREGLAWAAWPQGFTSKRARSWKHFGRTGPVPLKAGHLSLCALGEILDLTVPLIWGLALGEARGTS